MKILATIGLTMIVTVVGFSLLPQGSAATAPSAPAGRYTMTNLSPGQFALLLDTETGAVWQYGFGDYCQSATTGLIHQVGYGEQCKSGETSVSHIPMFQRVSVEGLYKTPYQSMIDHQLRP